MTEPSSQQDMLNNLMDLVSNMFSSMNNEDHERFTSFARPITTHFIESGDLTVTHADDGNDNKLEDGEATVLIISGLTGYQ